MKKEKDGSESKVKVVLRAFEIFPPPMDCSILVVKLSVFTGLANFLMNELQFLL